MDDIHEVSSLIHHACSLARELESNLPNYMENHLHLLIPSCENIVRAFNDAMVLLGSHSHNPSSAPPPAGMFLGESSEQRQELGVAGAHDLFSGAHTQPMDLIHALGAGVFPTSEMCMRDVGELGLEAPAGNTRGALELELGGLHMAGYVRSGDEESFQGLRASGDHVQAILEMEEPDSIIRSTPTVLRGHSLQRLRTRRDGLETYRIMVPAPSPQTPNPEMAPEDGHTWRKYGQKVILNSRYPRSYYRCAHRTTYGCDAKKQVQRLDDEPYIFQVTYHGLHTCLSGETRVVAESTQAQALPSMSRTSTQLGSWEEFEVDQREGNVPAETHAQEVGEGRGGAHEGEPSHVRDLNEMEGVVNIADFMFNSGSSDNSIDSIFPPKPKEDQN